LSGGLTNFEKAGTFKPIRVMRLTPDKSHYR
jgi:hypothetical protein